MKQTFELATLTLGGGALGISPLPGANGDLTGDLERVCAFGPALVISMTETAEMDALGAGALPEALRRAGIGWAHFPVSDYAIPTPLSDTHWPAIAARAHGVLARGGRVLVHCRGGLGRSGMVALRLMVETGESPQAALHRLRAIRPGAVETAEQLMWAQRD